MSKAPDLLDVLEKYDVYIKDCLSKELLDTNKQRAKQFAVDLNNLINEVAVQAGTYSYIAHASATQAPIMNTAKLKVDTIAAKIKKTMKDSSPGSGKSGGFTVDYIDSSVKSNPEYVKALADFRNAETRLLHIQADERASSMKSTMLRLLGGLVEREKTVRPYYDLENTEE
jgi:hypothetical protein